MLDNLRTENREVQIKLKGLNEQAKFETRWACLLLPCSLGLIHSSFMQRSAAPQYVKGLRRGGGLIWTIQIYIIMSQILTIVSYNTFRTIYIF
jgi:hypothetical protein